MRYLQALLLIFFPFILQAQSLVQGKVVNMETKAVLAGVSVFVDKTTYGTETTEDGTFNLYNVRQGQYEVVVSMVGYETYTKTISVSGSEPLKLYIELLPKVSALKPVTVTAKGNWKNLYELFVQDFLGNSDNARKTTILNPHVINLQYNKVKKVLTASSEEYLQIENKGLGYSYNILLKGFKSDHINNMMSCQGKVLYKELAGDEVTKKRWIINREECYYGSTMHFFRALCQDNLEANGFMVKRMFRRKNELRPADSIIVTKIDHFVRNGHVINSDSLSYWNNLYDRSKYRDSVTRDSLPVDSLAKLTTTKGIFAGTFPKYMYVAYKKKGKHIPETGMYNDIFDHGNVDHYKISTITKLTPYIFFDTNGTILNPLDVYVEGVWARDRIPELLPVDYVPPAH